MIVEDAGVALKERISLELAEIAANVQSLSDAAERIASAIDLMKRTLRSV
jgi:hypothetical protein